MYTIVYSNGTPYWLIDGRMIPVIAGGAPEDEEGDTEVQDEEEGSEDQACLHRYLQGWLTLRLKLQRATTHTQDY